MGLRVFIGVMLPEKIRDYVAGLQSGLEKLQMSCKMVERENIHICLSFIGEAAEPELESMKHSLSEICKGVQPIELSIGDIKIIPGEKYMRVIVLEVLEERGALNTVSSEIKKRIGGDVKPPHITLCRVRSVQDKEKVANGIRRIKLDKELRFTINFIELIQSVITREGPVYTTAYKAELSG